jgi:hypothetical protein
MKQNIIRNKWSILFLIIVSLILILPPIIYKYPYPSISDDPPAYIQVIDKVAHGDLLNSESYSYCYPTNVFGGESCIYRSAAPAFIGLICRIIHSDPFWTYYIFHYLALIGIALCVWLFCTKVFNKLTGYIGVLFVMFGATPVLRYSYYDQIFNITNLLGFGLMGCLALIYWLKTKRFYYALVSMMLFLIAVLFHSSTGLEIYMCVGFFLVSYVIYKAFRKAWKEVGRVGIYLSVFTLVCGALLWFLGTEAKGLLQGVLTGGSIKADYGINSVVPIYYFFTQDTSIILLLFATMAGWYLLRKRLIGIGIWMLVSFIFVFVVSVLINRFEPARSAQDLGIILLLAYSGLMGIALYHARTLPKIINAKKTIIFIILVACVPTLYGWFQFHCAITPIDQKAIDFMNSHNGSYSVSTQINPEIYELFVKNKYVPNGGDYTIYRSEPETAATTPTNRYTIVIGNASKESDYDYKCPRVAMYFSKAVTIIIYDTRQ